MKRKSEALGSPFFIIWILGASVVFARDSAVNHPNIPAKQERYEFYSGSRMLRANEYGRVQGNLLFQSKSFKYFDCDYLAKTTFWLSKTF